jgi:hypothetical protein
VADSLEGIVVSGPASLLPKAFSKPFSKNVLIVSWIRGPASLLPKAFSKPFSKNVLIVSWIRGPASLLPKAFSKPFSKNVLIVSWIRFMRLRTASRFFRKIADWNKEGKKLKTQEKKRFARRSMQFGGVGALF